MESRNRRPALQRSMMSYEWPLTGGGALSQISNGRDIFCSQVRFISRFAVEFGQTLSVVVEQKVFGFRLEQAKRG